MAKSPLGIHSPYLIAPRRKVRLEHISADKTGGMKKQHAAKLTEQHREQIQALQEKLYASSTRSVLIVVQGLDTAGKDGTISHIFDGVNPQGCNVQSFKVPTPLEKKHDFLWRVHAAAPPKGMIVIFNRSHYEDILWPYVHEGLKGAALKERFELINQFEQNLIANGTLILKFFLHITYEEQGKRLQSRIDDPSKHWKLSAPDFAERKFWPKYQQAYEQILQHTSTPHAPWFAIPANHKWYRNVAISDAIMQAMQGMKLEYPKPTVDVSTLKVH